MGTGEFNAGGRNTPRRFKLDKPVKAPTCYSIAGLHPNIKFACAHSFIHLGGERHCESSLAQEHNTRSPVRTAESGDERTNNKVTMPPRTVEKAH